MSKKSPRHLARSLALQAVYHYKINNLSQVELESVLEEFQPDLFKVANRDLLSYLVARGITLFDTMIGYYAPYLKRDVVDISLVEQCVLVIAAIELEDNLSVPAIAIINEAVELSKLYGATDSHKFINTLVDRLAHQLRSSEMQSYPKFTRSCT